MNYDNVLPSQEFDKCSSLKAPQNPIMAQLPMARLAAFKKPFTYVGVDYFGPIIVTVGRRLEKRWGVLFTCLTIRAIHIEIAHSLSTDSCIMAIRNFIARRGQPVAFYSDNGTNFHGVDNELKKMFKEVSQEEIQKRFTTTETAWHFNPPAAPHMGGSWERLVGSVKKNLRECLPERNPNDELLRTMLTEIESVINSRPLTFVSIDVSDQEALTPNHFLLGSSNGSGMVKEFNKNDLI